MQSGALTAGMMMRNAREASGLHVAALAVSMKIPVKKLEALEADRLDLLHDAVFVRALSASVCRALKIDPAPVLSQLPLTTIPRLSTDERGINAPFRTPGDSLGGAIPAMLTKPSAMIVLALLVGGLAVAFFPDIKVSDWSSEFSTRSVRQSADPSLFSPSPTEVVDVATAPAASASNMSATVTGSNEVVALPAIPVTSSSATADVNGAPASAPVLTANPSVAGSAVASSSLLVFKAKGSSWVKVVDAKGVVQLSKTLVDGDVVGASGSTPLSVIVGRVDVTDVEVRGKPFSLNSVAKENVARFEVK